MKSASILLVLAVITGAARGAQEGGCGRAGALRCESDSRHLSACTQRGAWRRVLDCGASHGACVNGRCVGGASARAEQCTPGEWSCSSDCVYKTICTSNNVWVSVSKCSAGEICDNGDCVDSATNSCRYNIVPTCAQGSANHYFPDVEDCSKYYVCIEEGKPPVGFELCNIEPNWYYQPCTGNCVSTSTICNRYQSCNGNEGLDAVIPGNPTLHYICANGTMFLMKCENPTAKYDPLSGKCVDIGVQCCPTTRMDVNSFSNFVTYDECDDSTSTSPCIVGDKREDPDDVCKYYYCYPPGVEVHMSCPANSKYDATQKSCVSASGFCLR